MTERALSTGNLFAALPQAGEAEVSDILFANAVCRVERIASLGHASPPAFWYEQDQDEWVLLASGHARLEFGDGRSVEMQAGDWISLPAGCRHRVAEVSADAVWLAVYCRAQQG